MEGSGYVSITGDPLNIKSKFPRSKQKYEALFLVSDNIRHECVLGWDFLSSKRFAFESREPSWVYFF